MIVKTTNADIIEDQNVKHIGICINKEGIFNTDILKLISKYIGPIGENELGTLITREHKGKIYHLLVCYSIKEGFSSDQKEILKSCLDKIDSKNQTITCIPAGTFAEDLCFGIDINEILKAFEECNKNINLCFDLDLDIVHDITGTKDRLPNKKLEISDPLKGIWCVSYLTQEEIAKTQKKYIYNFTDESYKIDRDFHRKLD